MISQRELIKISKPFYFCVPVVSINNLSNKMSELGLGIQKLLLDMNYMSFVLLIDNIHMYINYLNVNNSV